MSKIDNSQTSVRSIAKALTKLKLKSRDVLLVKKGCALDDSETIGQVGAILHKNGIRGVSIFIVENFDDLKAIPEETMNQMGWYKLRSIANIMKKKENENEV